MKTYTETLRTGLTTKEARTFVNREMIFETFKRYKAKGFNAELTSYQVNLDGWSFTWDEGYAIMKTTLRGETLWKNIAGNA